MFAKLYKLCVAMESAKVTYLTFSGKQFSISKA